MYRLDIKSKKIEEIDKSELWRHFKYFCDLTPIVKKQISEALDLKGSIRTPYYIFSYSENVLIRKRSSGRL